MPYLFFTGYYSIYRNRPLFSLLSIDSNFFHILSEALFSSKHFFSNQLFVVGFSSVYNRLSRSVEANKNRSFSHTNPPPSYKIVLWCAPAPSPIPTPTPSSHHSHNWRERALSVNVGEKWAKTWTATHFTIYQRLNGNLPFLVVSFACLFLFLFRFLFLASIVALLKKGFLFGFYLDLFRCFYV